MHNLRLISNSFFLFQLIHVCNLLFYIQFTFITRFNHDATAPPRRFHGTDPSSITAGYFMVGGTYLQKGEEPFLDFVPYFFRFGFLVYLLVSHSIFYINISADYASINNFFTPYIIEIRRKYPFNGTLYPFFSLQCTMISSLGDLNPLRTLIPS